MKNQTVDVVIPVYHPGESFGKLLDMLGKQTRTPSKIILMITENGEKVHPEYDAVPRLEYHSVRPEAYDHGGTRTSGAAFGSSGYILFMTEDAVPEGETFIERLLSGFEDPGVAAVYARQLPRENAGPIERFTRGFNYPAESRTKRKEDLETFGIKTFFCSNVSAMYDRACFESLGGFFSPTIFNEDMLFAHKLIMSGHAVRYEASARVIHSHAYTGKEQYRRNFDLAVSQADHPEVFASVSSEGEGMKLVKSTAKYLLKSGNFYRLPQLIYESGMKYLGYRKGLRYRSLSPEQCMKNSTNKNYWRKFYGTDQSHKV